MPPLAKAEPSKIKFMIVGLMVTSEFQQCQFIVNKLHQYYPDKYHQPEIRAMLNVDWAEHLAMIKRQYGGDLWRLRVPVAVFVDGRYLGDHTTLLNYVSSTYSFSWHEDFEHLGEGQLVQHFRRLSEMGRDFVSLTIAKDSHVIGSLLVMLYTDLVPKTCRFFLSRCHKNLWDGSRVVRVVKRSWMQIQGARAHRLIMPCENYAVPHDRRGVLSMCNLRRHVLNSTDFHISLGCTPWMDHKYVGFGLVVQGEEVLAALESAPAIHEVPGSCVVIVDTQEFVLDAPLRPDPELIKDTTKTVDDTGSHKKQYSCHNVEDAASLLDEERFKEGLYCKESDLTSHLPFMHLPERLLAYLKSQEMEAAEEGQRPKPEDDSPSSYTASSLSSNEDRFVNRSKGFLARSIEDMKAMIHPGDAPDPLEYYSDRAKSKQAFIRHVVGLGRKCLLRFNRSLVLRRYDKVYTWDKAKLGCSSALSIGTVLMICRNVK